MAKKQKNRKGRKLTPEQKKEQTKKRQETAFRNKIRKTIVDSGFTYFATANKEFKIGNRVVELDYLFIYV